MNEIIKTPEILRQGLRHLETAVAAHIAWLTEWHVQIVNAVAKGEKISIEDGTIQTPFRKWYYGQAQDVFGDSPAYPALGFSLEAMQSNARQLANKANETGQFPIAEYQEFMSAIATFNERTFKLQRETLFQVAHIDDLTGAGDVTAMRSDIEGERERVKRAGQDATVVVCELADYTDREGTPVDANRSEVLVEFAVTIAGQLRPYDQLYRIDNDEFLVCLPYTDITVAEHVIKRLHGKVSGSTLKMKDGLRIKLKTHMGIAPIGAEESVETILEHAKDALENARLNALTDVYSWEG